MDSQLRTGIVRRWAVATTGLVSLCVGGLFMAMLIIGMHRLEDRPDRTDRQVARIIEVVREKQEERAVVNPVEPPPPKIDNTPRAPLPQLDLLLAGIDLGIPEFAVEDFAQSARSLLGEVSRGGIMNESNVDSKPRVLSRTALNFPRDALKRGINGYVLINLLINESGEIEAAKVLDAEPKGVFEAAALRGVQGWRFSPARYQGKPVKVWAKQRVRFDAK